MKEQSDNDGEKYYLYFEYIWKKMIKKEGELFVKRQFAFIILLMNFDCLTNRYNQSYVK